MNQLGTQHPVLKECHKELLDVFNPVPGPKGKIFIKNSAHVTAKQCGKTIEELDAFKLDKFRHFFGKVPDKTLADLVQEADDYGMNWGRFYADFDPGNEATMFMVLYGLNGGQERINRGRLQGIDMKAAAYYFPKSLFWSTSNPRGYVEITLVHNKSGHVLYDYRSSV